jgi:hypothetical protein
MTGNPRLPTRLQCSRPAEGTQLTAEVLRHMQESARQTAEDLRYQAEEAR